MALPSLATVEGVLAAVVAALEDADKLGIIKDIGLESVFTEVVTVLTDVEGVLKEL